LKFCPECEQEKELSEYHARVNKTGSISYSKLCKVCYNARALQWKKDNPEKHAANRVTFEAKPERIQYLKRNGVRQRTTGYSLEWQREHPDKCKSYTQKHRDHDITEKEWRSCLEVFENTCAYCGLPQEKHIVKRNGIYIIMNFHKEHVDDDGYNDLRNAIPSCQSCNSSKHQDNMEEWYRQQNFFNEQRYNNIIWWITEGYKDYIEDKPPYRIIKKKNEHNNKFHHELWTVDEYRNMIECIDIKDKKKDILKGIKTV
jgi:hypothetical protein